MSASRLSGLLLGLGLAGLAQAAPLAEGAPALGDSLPPLLARVEGHNPELAAMAAEVEAARQRIPQARAWDDPTFKVEWQDIDADRPTLAPARVGGMKYTVEQMLPRWGTRELKARVAQAGTEQAEYDRQDRRLLVRSQVRSAYADWYRVLESVRINSQLRLLVEQIEEAAQQRYATGQGAQADVLRAQTEVSLLKNERLALDGEARQARATLAALLDLAPEALTGEPRELPELASEREETEWLTRALARNPALLALGQQQQAAAGAQRLSQLNNRPDVGLGVSAIQMGSSLTNYELMLSVTLPLQQGARQAERDEASAMLSRARALELAKRRELEGALHGLVARLQSSRQQRQLIASTLLPQANLTFDSALAGYAAGGVEFSMLLDAQQQIRKLDEMALMTRLVHFQAGNALLNMMGEQ